MCFYFHFLNANLSFHFINPKDVSAKNLEVVYIEKHVKASMSRF